MFGIFFSLCCITWFLFKNLFGSYDDNILQWPVENKQQKNNKPLTTINSYAKKNSCSLKFFWWSSWTFTKPPQRELYSNVGYKSHTSIVIFKGLFFYKIWNKDWLDFHTKFYFNSSLIPSRIFIFPLIHILWTWRIHIPFFCIIYTA